MAYILGDSDSRVVFAENDLQMVKLREKRPEIPGVQVVTFDGESDGDWVSGFAELDEARTRAAGGRAQA